jgi:hypothetical protein
MRLPPRVQEFSLRFLLPILCGAIHEPKRGENRPSHSFFRLSYKVLEYLRLERP